jgi:PhnB protein
VAFQLRPINEELIKAGIMLAGEGLRPSSTGGCVRSSGTDRIVTGGRFAETKELVVGCWIWEVESMEEAVTWLKRCPNPMPEDSEVEIRAIWSLEDIASVNSASGCSSVP